MNQKRRLSHFLGPVYDEKSRVLILGTFPSDKSRDSGFFYGHPQNRFWRVLAAIFECELPRTIEQKRSLLLNNGVALWDVIESCEIVGSSDSSIRNVIPADVGFVLRNSPIEDLYANGKMAEKLYKKHLEGKIGKKITALPSTSPANAVYSLERLIDTWSIIRG
ncbi:MAG: DNA-deoxyinosine glycosylase [Clostridiales bacterium]|nr:DNA-deoxyinosine glycosylase [Clostridiales bacterium]